MGMYDTVWINCPKCNEKHGFQTKSGECYLANYTLENCPDDALKNVNRHSPYKCDCGAMIEVDVQTRKIIVANTMLAAAAVTRMN